MWSGPYRPLTIGIVALITLIAFEGIGASTAMPAVATDLNILGDYTWAFTAYTVASLFAMVAAGLWSDATGPRGPVVVGVLTFLVGSVLAGIAVNLPVLIMGRALEGLGTGAIIVAVYVLIARAFDESARPRAFSVLAAAWVLPSLVGPLVAGWLTQSISWRAVFLLVPLFVIPPLLLLVPRMRDFQGGSPQPGARRRLMAGLVATAALFAMQDGLLRVSIVGGVEAVVGLALLLLSLQRLLPAGALRFARGLPTSVMMRGLIAATYFSAEVFIPLALVQIRGVSVTYAGMVLAGSAAMWSLGSYTQSRIPGDRDRSATVRAGLTLVIVSVVTLPLSMSDAVPPWVAGISWGIGAFGMGMSIPSVAVQVMRLSRDDDQGRNSAAIQIVDAVCVSLVVSLLSLGYAAAVHGKGVTAGTYTALWRTSAAVGLVGFVVASRMRPRAD